MGDIFLNHWVNFNQTYHNMPFYKEKGKILSLSKAR